MVDLDSRWKGCKRLLHAVDCKSSRTCAVLKSTSPLRLHGAELYLGEAGTAALPLIQQHHLPGDGLEGWRIGGGSLVRGYHDVWLGHLQYQGTSTLVCRTILKVQA